MVSLPGDYSGDQKARFGYTANRRNESRHGTGFADDQPVVLTFQPDEVTRLEDHVSFSISSTMPHLRSVRFLRSTDLRASLTITRTINNCFDGGTAIARIGRNWRRLLDEDDLAENQQKAAARIVDRLV